MQRSLIIALAVGLVLALVSVGGVYWAFTSTNATLDVRQEWREYADGWEVTLIASVSAPSTATVSPEAEIDYPGYSLQGIKVTFPEQPTVQQPGASYTVPLSFKQAEAGPTVIISAKATEYLPGFMRSREIILGPQQVKLTPPARQLAARLAELDGAWMKAKPHLSVRQDLNCWKVRGSVGYEEREKVRLLANKFLIASERFYLDGKLIEERAYTPDEKPLKGFECDIPRAAGPKGHIARVEGSLWHRKVGSTEEAPQWEEWPMAPTEEPLVIPQWKPRLSATAAPCDLARPDLRRLDLSSDTPGLVVKAAGATIRLDAQGKGNLYITAKPGYSRLHVTGVDLKTGMGAEALAELTNPGLAFKLSTTSLDLTRGKRLAITLTSKRQGYVSLLVVTETDPGASVLLAYEEIAPDKPLEVTWDGTASWGCTLADPDKPVPEGTYRLSATFREGQALAFAYSEALSVASAGQRTTSKVLYSDALPEELVRTESPYRPKTSYHIGDASFKLAFTGEKVGFQYYKLPHGGQVDVLLDGKQIERLDLASPNADYHEGYWISKSLPSGNHVLEARRVENPKDYRPVDIRSFRIWP